MVHFGLGPLFSEIVYIRFTIKVNHNRTYDQIYSKTVHKKRIVKIYALQTSVQFEIHKLFVAKN